MACKPAVDGGQAEAGLPDKPPVLGDLTIKPGDSRIEGRGPVEVINKENFNIFLASASGL